MRRTVLSPLEQSGHRGQELRPGLSVVRIVARPGSPSVPWLGLGTVGLLSQGSTLDVEVRSEELLRQLSHAIKNQLGHPKTQRGFENMTQQVTSCLKLVLYGIRAPIIDPFLAWKQHPYDPLV